MILIEKSLSSQVKLLGSLSSISKEEKAKVLWNVLTNEYFEFAMLIIFFF